MEPSSSIAGFELKFGCAAHAGDAFVLSIPVLAGVEGETLFLGAKPLGLWELPWPGA